MCLIIASPTGKHPAPELVAEAIFNNPDGWGIVHLEGKGKLTATRGFSLPDLTTALQGVTSPYVLHFRFATAGKVDLNNCHPFKVNRGLYVAHNGVLNVPQPDKAYSDTWHFVEHTLKPVFKTAPSALGDAEFLKELETAIGKGNKLAFMDQTGDITIVNREAGVEHEGMWLSNSYSIPDPLGTSWDWDYERRARYEPSDNGLAIGAIEFDAVQECDYCGTKSLVQHYSTDLESFLCETCYRYYCDELPF